MQTFMPYADFEKSILCLDPKRRNKQAVESSQIITTLDDRYYKYFPHRKQNKKSQAWKNHPAVLMWKDAIGALVHYYNINLEICINKFKVNYKLLVPLPVKEPIKMPVWFGHEPFHLSHRSNLLKKYPEYYKDKEGFKDISPNIPYLWINV